MSNLDDYWERKRSFRAAQAARGETRVWRVRGRLQVSTPYSTDFIAGARELGGRWRPKSQVWSFPLKHEREVELLIVKCREKAE